MIEFFDTIYTAVLGSNPQAAWVIMLNLFLIETLLSIDNAAVLATMVMDLPENQRSRALKWGIGGAYIFRGLSLLFASYLIQISWLKAVGGLYLLYLAFDYFWSKYQDQGTQDEEDGGSIKQKHWFHRATVGKLGLFWSTVLMVEVMDMAFSIDNVFAAVAFTDNIYQIWIGVFVGILAMRFVAQGFVKLLKSFPFMEKIAFLVIAILGLKLIASFAVEFSGSKHLIELVNGHNSDTWFSIFTILIFVLPILFSWLTGNFNKKESPESV